MQVPLAYVGLGEQSAPLTLDQAKHLMRRIGFGASEAQLQWAIGQSANSAVEALVDGALDVPLPTDPDWAGQIDLDNTYQKIQEYRYDMFRQMYNRGFAEKMAFFWHDHFASEIHTHNQPAFTHKAITLYRSKALGNFFELLEEVGKGPDMLHYLSGIYNQAGSPNENYARELLELFTMGQTSLLGQENYTEEDIREVARALTGWVINEDIIEGEIDPERFDSDDKTIFSQPAANHDYASLHQLIKTQRGTQTAEFIVGKLYKYFVYEYPNTQIVSELATYFIAQNWSIAALMKRMLKSQHFFQDNARGCLYKTPIGYQLGAMIDSDYEINDEPDRGTFRYLLWACSDQGLRPLSANDVSGWDEYRGFISTGNFATRWDFARSALYGWNNDMPTQDLVSWASGVCNNSTNPPEITAQIVNRLLVHPLPAEMMLALENTFRSNIPPQEYENGFWTWSYPDVDRQVILLLFEIYKLPEYNLI